MNEKLFMILLGGRTPGRQTEQHDIFFGIGADLKSLVPEMIDFWPELNGTHIDNWRDVRYVDGFKISIVPKGEPITADESSHKLFFINLGGYKEDDFDELHYKMIVVAENLAEAKKVAKETAFFKHTDMKTAPSHIDDKYGIDVDDSFEIADALSASMKNAFRIKITPSEVSEIDELHQGYLLLSKIK